MDIFKGFDSLSRTPPTFFDASGALIFSARRDILENAAITVEVGPHILHTSVGLISDGAIDFPDLEWSSPPEAMINCVLRPSRVLLARLQNLSQADRVVAILSSKSPFPLAYFTRDSIPGSFATADYIAHVSDKVGRNHWWSGAAFLRDDILHVHGWAIPPKDWQGGLPTVLIDGSVADVAPCVSPFAQHAYWFLAGEVQTGFYAKAPIAGPSGFSKIEVSFGEADTRENIRRFPVYQTNGSKPALPIPPAENIHRVSGPTSNEHSYLNGGKSDFERFRTLIKEYTDRDIQDLEVLDWGVGCGRLGRHFIEHGAKFTGIDIDADNIQWCRDNLQPGQYETVPLMPPTMMNADRYDAIISSSVLSHLSETVMHAWLEEIARMLHPKGLAFLSFNGDGNAYLYGSIDPEAIRELDGYGFFDKWRTSDLDGKVEGAEEYYRFTIMSDERARAIFADHFEIVDIVRGVTSGHQDIAVLRRRYARHAGVSDTTI